MDALPILYRFAMKATSEIKCLPVPEVCNHEKKYRQSKMKKMIKYGEFKKARRKFNDQILTGPVAYTKVTTIPHDQAQRTINQKKQTKR